MSTTVALRLAWSAGNATLTTVPSMKAMLEPRMATARIHGSAAFAQGTTSLPDRITASSQGAMMNGRKVSEERKFQLRTTRWNQSSAKARWTR